jgi:hypothetical protein
LSWRWGGFLFTHKTGRDEDSGAWQITCFRHTSRINKLKCTKTNKYQCGKSEVVQRALKQWAIKWDQHCTADVIANKTGHQKHFGDRILEIPLDELLDEASLEVLKPDSDDEMDGDDLAAIALASAASAAAPPSSGAASSSGAAASSSAPAAKRRRS